MPQSPESKAADDALHEAIRRVMLVDEPESEAANLLLTDWVVAYAAVRADDESVTAYGACYPPGSTPAYRSLGLIEILRQQLLTRGWGDDAG